MTAIAETPPNVIIVVMDTTRALDTVPPVKDLTPTLTDLADRGACYTNAFSSSPWTLPSHASLFTGTYSSKHGAHSEHTFLGNSLETLAETFENVGYETVAISNNTWITDEFGFGSGFETLHKNWQLVQSTTDLGTIIREKELGGKFAAFIDRVSSGNPITNVVNTIAATLWSRLADDGASRTNRWIEDWLDQRDSDHPFFLFVNYLEPHLQYRPPPRHVSALLPTEISYEQALSIPQDPRAFDAGKITLSTTELEILTHLYRGELSYLDARIGDLIELILDRNYWEDTIFVVVGDHGENVGDHGFLGHQYNVYDTLLHVPLFVHGGPFRGGKRVNDLVQVLDLAPTLLDAAGIDCTVAKEQYQGRSFHPGAPARSRDAVYAEYMAPQPPIESLVDRFGNVPDKLWIYDRSLRTIRTKRAKYIRGSDGSEEFYDVVTDPGETTNLIHHRRAHARELMDRLDAWVGSFDHAQPSGSADMTRSTEKRLKDLGYL